MNLKSYINPHLQQLHSRSGSGFFLTTESELLSLKKKSTYQPALLFSQLNSSFGTQKPNKRIDSNIQFGLNFSSTFTILLQKSVLLLKKCNHQDTCVKTRNTEIKMNGINLRNSAFSSCFFSLISEYRTRGPTKSRLPCYDLFFSFLLCSVFRYYFFLYS